MKYRVVHRTEYVYAEPVTLCHNETHLTPRSTAAQRVHEHHLEIEPRPDVLSRREDFFGNPVVYFAVQSAHPRLVVTARSQVERKDGAAHPELSRATWEDAAARTATDDTPAGLDVRQYLLDSPMAAATPAIAAWARESFPAGRPLLDAVRDLTSRIHRNFAYEPGVTTIATPLAEAFEERRGVCQDFAHLGIACLRSVGLAASYVSGYIETVPPPGKERLAGADASHAWFAVYDPDAGWLNFDPTNDQLVVERHITTAWGREYSDVTPMKGIIFGGGPTHTAKVSVDIERVAD
ncbi:MAG TPA: transglutaminase family protein [Candidatus Eisenbacteria bacterium]|nr:transglutaminase family protein [Candidatus Eisenbacteria bacterium]